MTESVEFNLPNAAYGIMTGDTREDVRGRINVLRAFYSQLELTPETHTVVMPNGLPVTGVPIGLTVSDILLLADAAASIVDQMKNFPLCEQLESQEVH